MKIKIGVEDGDCMGIGPKRFRFAIAISRKVYSLTIDGVGIELMRWEYGSAFCETVWFHDWRRNA